MLFSTASSRSERCRCPSFSIPHIPYGCIKNPTIFSLDARRELSNSFRKRGQEEGNQRKSRKSLKPLLSLPLSILLLALEEAINVFYHYIYEGSVDIDSVADPATILSSWSESLAYTLIFLIKGRLPWQGYRVEKGACHDSNQFRNVLKKMMNQRENLSSDTI
ncbi:unnamed protein product [Fraxinus pennsylvanica]|uniref:Uncharacterized protein n=1 Tax=Fraxinus pennsylvanica TaxID=56036 RepID=A0AAD2A3X3_9LAMI|nr:unnamed protein product [Fraxinus pennsylvanica]